MRRQNVQLTTLEEDFRKIGLLSEDDVSEAPISEDTDTEADETEDGEELDEALRRRRQIKAGGGVRMKKLTPETADKKRARRQSRKDYRRKKAKIKRARKRWERSSSGRRYKKAYSKAMAKESSDRIANLVDSINSTLHPENQVEESAETPQADNAAVKAYANVAIIAEALSKYYDVLAEASGDLNVFGLHKLFLEMAQGAANTAKQLHEGEVTPEDVEDEFKAVMEHVLEGVELYSDLEELKEQAVAEQEGIVLDEDDDDDDIDTDEAPEGSEEESGDDTAGF